MTAQKTKKGRCLRPFTFALDGKTYKADDVIETTVKEFAQLERLGLVEPYCPTRKTKQTEE